MPNKYSEVVAAGMAWLDANEPLWVEAFVADRGTGLHMADCDRCVLGYVYGSYWDLRSPIQSLSPRHIRGLGLLGREWAEEHEKLNLAAAAMGFTLPTTADEMRGTNLDVDAVELQWELLGEAWLEVIEERLAART